MLRSSEHLHRRVFVLALVLALGVLGLADPSSAASERATAARAVTLSAPSSAVAGSRVTLKGRVLEAKRGSKVKIQRWTGKSWKTRTTTTTRSGGRFATSLVVSEPGLVKYRAYTTRRGSVRKSATVRLDVLRRTSVRVQAAQTNLEPGTPATLKVTTSPAQRGGPVQLQTRRGNGVWTSAGTATLTSAGTATFRPKPTSAGLVQYRVVKARYGYSAAATSAAAQLSVQRVVRFGELMNPSSNQVLDPAVATWSHLPQQPAWWSRNVQIRWDAPGAFTSSLNPAAAGTFTSDLPVGATRPEPDRGAEYNNGNSSLQTTDISFKATGTTFAIRYQTYDGDSSMLWIDGHPVSATPVRGVAPPTPDSVQINWIQVTLPQRRTVHVRFAGPANFVGVDHDALEPLTVTAAPYPFTVAVVSDSFFDGSVPYRTYEGSAASVLHTRTGFRVWGLAEGGTGYINDATGAALTGDAGYPGHYASPFGSDARIARIANAPIDALVVNGSINDAWYDHDLYAAAVNRYLDRVAQVRPELPVVIVGIQPVRVFPDEGAPEYRADMDAKNQILKTIAAQHANVVGFIDPYGERWLTGTGSITAPKGDGNQDLYVAPDHIHLSPAGQVYYQDLIADQLALLPIKVRSP